MRPDGWTHSVDVAPCDHPPPQTPIPAPTATTASPPNPPCRPAARKRAPSRGVPPPLGPDVSHCPVIHRSRRGERPLLPPGGRPPNRTLKYAHRKEAEGENHIFQTREPRPAPPRRQRPPRNAGKKRLQLTVMLITIGRNKSQAGKSLDGNCYNCPDDGNEYFSPLNYK